MLHPTQELEPPANPERFKQLRAAAKAEGHEVRADVDILRTDPRLLEEGAFGRTFNAEAAADEGDVRDDRGEGEGEGDRKARRSWKQRSEEKGHKHGRGRSGGYGYGRDD